MTINNANELLAIMRLGGYELTVMDGGLKVRQARWIDDELAEFIRTHKFELIRILESESSHGK